MIKNTTFAAAFIAAVSLFSASFAVIAPTVVAQETDQVLVRVNGYEIRTSEVSLAAEAIASQLANLPPQARYPFVVQYLVERHLLAQEAIRQNIEQDPEYKRLLGYYQAKAARDAYFVGKIKPQVTEQDARAEYDKQATAVDQQEKIHLRLIQVKDEAAAKKVHKQLVEGADFVELANQNAPAQSVKNGGDLGWFTQAEMAEELVKATKGLNAGEISQPYKSKLGWNIIKLDEKTVVTAQPFEKIKGGLVSLLTRQKVQALVDELTAKAKIEVIDADLKKLQEKKANQQ